MKPTSADSAVLNLQLDAGPVAITGTGSGGEWTFADPALKEHVHGRSRTFPRNEEVDVLHRPQVGRRGLR